MYPLQASLPHTDTHTYFLCPLAVTIDRALWLFLVLHCDFDAFWSLLCNTHTHTHSRAAVEVLGEWADAAAGSGAFDRDAHLTWVKRELSVTLVRGNARLFKKFVGVLTRGIGQRCVEGMDMPVLE